MIRGLNNNKNIKMVIGKYLEELYDKSRGEIGEITKSNVHLFIELEKSIYKNKLDTVMKSIFLYHSRNLDRDRLIKFFVLFYEKYIKLNKIRKLCEIANSLKYVITEITRYPEEINLMFNELKMLFIVAFICCSKKNNLIINHRLVRFINYTYLHLLRNDEYLKRLLKENSIVSLINLADHLQEFEMKILKLEKMSQDAGNIERKLITRCDKINIRENILYIMKKYNSVYPAILGEEVLGGGYFIKWHGKGIVVDPGYDFFNQFTKSGFNIYDIDCIFVTHAHDDHCNDLETIYSVLNKFNKYCKRKKKVYLFGSNNVILKYSYLENYYERTIFPLPKGCSKRAAELLNKVLHDNKILMKVNVLSAFHSEKPFINESSVGLCLTMLNKYGNDIPIIFSGDTSFNDKIVNEYRKMKPAIVILNLGKVEENINEYYNNHLGIRGCKTIISKLINEKYRPIIILISEFGIEAKRNRIEISELIKEVIKIEYPIVDFKNVSILPADNTLKIELNKFCVIGNNRKKIPLVDVECIYEDNNKDNIIYI